ncbi:MAG: ribose 5-phosphate isomerase B [Oscillospiraceae bacterium]|nr:ribose 5-phosphate isomerase B [Oscillospiraceae bacterium]
MIALGSDHGGYLYKEELKKHLDEKGIGYVDFGTTSTESCDYPVYAEKVCKAIQSGECEKGILICGTGIGMSICANKFKGIRAAVCGDHFSAEFTRKHNDSNVLCMGARTIGAGVALQLADIFLSTEFEGGRHQKRIDMMMSFEGK